MKISYDPRYNIAYICFKEKTGQVETIQVSAEMNIDIAPDGTIYGIELLNANSQLGATPDKTLLVINEAVGESSKIKLAL
ncbi:MAG: DUF2283 domain-containing protein [Cyanobacteriota bacterium]|nr:DUF2283 domain-containing protein [Cyanobacteriota bacterium]